MALLSRIAKAEETLADVLGGGAANRLRAAYRDDLDPVEVEPELRSDRLEHKAIADPFDEDDSHARKLA